MEAAGAGRRPAFVLVHGGGHGAWCWEALAPLLAAPAVAVDLPGRGSRPADLSRVTIDDCVHAVVTDIVRHDLTDVVLVGHSLGAVTACTVAARLPQRIRHLVLIAGFVPPQGRSVVDTLPFGIRQIARASLPRSATRRMPKALIRRTLCNDMTRQQAAAVLERIGPDAPALMGDPVSFAGLPADVPRTYIRFTRDRNLPARKAARMAAAIGAGEPTGIEAGHDGIISQPERVASELNKLLTSMASQEPAQL